MKRQNPSPSVSRKPSATSRNTPPNTHAQVASDAADMKTRSQRSDTPTLELTIDPKTAANDPPHAAKGVDDVMSQPPPVKAGAGEPPWHQGVAAAKARWDQLSEAELLATDGCAIKLGNLVQQRYGISSSEAAEQVDTFLVQHRLKSAFNI